MKCIDEYYASSYHLSVEELNNINVHLASGLVKVDGLKKESSRVRFWCFVQMLDTDEVLCYNETTIGGRL